MQKKLHEQMHLVQKLKNFKQANLIKSAKFAFDKTKTNLK